MKKIICVCSGGLGNRLRPMSSCAKLASESNRKLLIWWIKDHRCGVEFNDLFVNDYDFISKEKIELLNSSVKSYIHSANGILLSSEIIGEPLIWDIYNKFPREPIHNIALNIKNDLEEFIFVFHDDFINFGKSESIHLQGLKPIEQILKKIESFAKENSIGKHNIGVHARGSDFFTNISFYVDKIKEISKTNKKSVFFLISDDKRYEDEIKKSLPELKIITRSGKHFVKKKNPKKSYKYNALMTTSAIIDSVVDLYLLSKTNILIGNDASTYFQICKIIEKGDDNANIN